MKEKFLKHKKLWIWVLVLAVVATAVTVLLINSLSGKPATKKISIDEAQVLVDDAFGKIAKSSAMGAKYILSNTKITVEKVEYGNNKDIILTCNYSALDVKAALSGKINQLMHSAYTLYQQNEDAGKKTNATKVNLHVKQDIVTALEAAPAIKGQVKIYIYETTTGLQLHLEDSMVNTITGGLIDITNAIKNTNTVEYNGETINIKNKTTLRTGISDCVALENYSSAKPITGGKLTVAWENFKHDFKKNFIVKERWKYLVDGLINTLSITLFAALLGLCLGFIIAVIRCTNQMTGKLKIPNAICRLYLTVMRGTPVMVQLLILFFVFLLPMGVDKFIAAVICFGLNSGAYVAEIVRGGIMSVDKGQIEAGRSIGFNYLQTMVHFVIPQAFKAILPALANEFITLLKESSVAFYVGVADLTAGGLKIRSITYDDFMPLIAVAVIYLILVMILTKLVSILERRLAKSDH